MNPENNETNKDEEIKAKQDGDLKIEQKEGNDKELTPEDRNIITSAIAAGKEALEEYQGSEEAMAENYKTTIPQNEQEKKAETEELKNELPRYDDVMRKIQSGESDFTPEDIDILLSSIEAYEIKLKVEEEEDKSDGKHQANERIIAQLKELHDKVESLIESPIKEAA